MTTPNSKASKSYDARSAWKAGDYLEQQAENMESGIPQDQHEAECRESEAIVAGCETPNEVETMADSEPRKMSKLDRAAFVRVLTHLVCDENPIPESILVDDPMDGSEPTQQPAPTIPKPCHGFCGSVIEIPVQSWFHPKSARTTPPLLCDHLSLELARTVAVEFNERSIRRRKRSWAVVVRRRPKLFGVIKLPYIVSSTDRDPESDHPEIEMKLMKAVDADNEAARLNESILRVSRCPKRWHVVAVSTS